MMECIFTERNCIITVNSLQISNQFPDQNIIKGQGRWQGHYPKFKKSVRQIEQKQNQKKVNKYCCKN